MNFRTTSNCAAGGGHSSLPSPHIPFPVTTANSETRKRPSPSNTPAATHNPAPLLDRLEAATYLGLKPQTLANWAVTRAHNLPYVKVGRNVRYRKQDLDAFIQRNLHGTSFDAIATEGANV
ncbi:helix-turn-helix domain-containing protein [Ralstonia chuxiongensis]|uniref:helix-turn-helix domain-containing protein n=1 Tax=Ralstonia chuxiongensis TaxID=2957504 RepID=UPI0028F6063A|nr:helix-turn-helix domain-containing protein [Ralstonia chuxiongensis]CAJ0776271.1 hypothetical protein R8510_04221 [Ralstonia chuxiongensis]